MSEDYITSRPLHDARRNFRRKSHAHVDKLQKMHHKVQIDAHQHAQTVSINAHPKKSKPANDQASFNYTGTKLAKNVLIASNHPARALPTKTLITTAWKPESPTNTTTSIATKYEQMGKTSYKEHMMKVRQSKLTLSNSSHSIKEKMWSGYNKSMHPCKLRMKIKEKILSNRMIRIVMYLGTLSRETQRRNQIKKLFRKTMRIIVFQTRVNDMKQRLIKFYKKQASTQLQIHQPMLDVFSPVYSNYGQWKTISVRNRQYNIQLSKPTNSRVPSNKIQALTGWIKRYSSENSVFRLLGEGKLNKVLNNINFTTQHYKAGQRIFCQGSAAEYFYVVLSGTVSIWAEKYDSKLALDADLSNQDPYTVPQMSSISEQTLPTKDNVNNQTSYVSMMQVFFQCFEKCQEFKTGDTFGELAFENNDSCHHSTAIAKESCILAGISKTDYEKFFQSLVLHRQQETLNIFHHFKTSSEETFSLERCNLLKSVAETVSYDTADIVHGLRNKDDSGIDHVRDNDDYIYILVQGSVGAYYLDDTHQSNLIKNSLYNRTTQLRKILKKAPLLKLGKGELLDPRIVVEKGVKLRPDDEETNIIPSKSNNIYFMATSPVILLKLNAQSFFRISRFDFWSIYRTSQSTVEFAIQQLKYQPQIKTILKNKRKENLQIVKKRPTTAQKRQKQWQREENLQMFLKTEEAQQADEEKMKNATLAHQQISNDTESDELKIPTINTKLPRPLPVKRCTSTDLILMMR